MPETDDVDQVDGQQENDTTDENGGEQSQRERPSATGRGQQRTTRTGNRDQGQPDTSGEDDSSSSGKTFTQADIDRIVADRVARAEKKFADYGDLKKKASKLDEIEAANKTELEKLNDQLSGAQVELQTLRVEKIRGAAGAEANLDPSLWKYITAADPDEALSQAKELAALAKPEPKTADFRQGSRPSAKQSMTRDELIRGLAGH